MRLLVFQHIDCEHPGSLRDHLRSDQIPWTPVNLHRGEGIPDLGQFDALWVMGGPMDVWDVDDYPWLVAEKAAIRTWVRDLGKPYLGLCLGHQLLADALGGTCGPQVPPEIGVLDVDLISEGIEDSIFAQMSTRQKCLQWHSVRVAQAPDNATVLARSELCPIQAMRVGNNAWSMQYHVEVESDTVENWGQVPAYRDALINTLGAEGMKSIQSDSNKHMHEFQRSSAVIYRNFMRLTG